MKATPTPYIIDLVNATAPLYGTTPQAVLGRCRHKLTVAARYECIARAAFETGASSTQLGRWFGRDHTTILYALGRRAER
jgi:chromosomal replication initiation ATPase DnaA